MKLRNFHLPILLILASLKLASPQSTTADYSLNPAQGVPGKSYGLVVQSKKNDLKDGTTIRALGRGISLDSKADCHDSFCTATLTLAADADYQQTFIEVGVPSPTPDKMQKTLLPFSVIAQPAGAIPPGMTRPEVDVAWKVLPKEVTSDNFGSRVSKLYYAVVAFVGNNSGFDLQISGLYFQLPVCPTDRADPKIKEQTGCVDSNFPIIPSDPYRTVRSSLEREQEIGMRNTSINIIKAIGPMATGATAFFRGSSTAALHHKATYSTLVDIFSNPFEKGLELIFPDETVRQLVALDNQTLRDSAIISNNTTVPLLVFVDKRLLSDSLPGDLKEKLNGIHNRHDPKAVMERLGTLKLEGNIIEHVRRISITSNAPKPTAAPPSSTAKPSLTAQTAASVQMQGNNLEQAAIVPQDNRISVKDVKVDPNGKVVTATIDPDKVPPGTYNLILTTPGGSVTVPLTVAPKAPAPAAPHQ